MKPSNAFDRVGRENRLLKIIATVAPDIPPRTLLSRLAFHVLALRGRTAEELAYMAKHRYFAGGTPEQRQRESEYFEKYQGLDSEEGQEK